MQKNHLQEIPADLEHDLLSPFLSRKVKEPMFLTVANVSLSSSKIGKVDFDISETQESKIAEKSLSISTTPLHEPILIKSNSFSSNER